MNKIASTISILLLLFMVLHPFLVHASASPEDKITIPFAKKVNVTVDGLIKDNEYPYQYSDPKNGMKISWVHDSKYVYVGVDAPGTGWVGVGFGSSSMNKANIIIGYVDDKTAEVIISDETGKGFTHKPDTELGGSNDIVDFAGTQSNGHTIIEFVFPLRSSDKLDPPIDPGKEIPIILAYHPSADDLTSYHGRTYDIIKVFVEPSTVSVNSILTIKATNVKAVMGDAINITVSLTTSNGKPIPNALIHIYTTTSLKVAGFVEVSQVTTNDNGMARSSIVYDVPGNFTIMAKFEGGKYKPSESNPLKVTIYPPTKKWVIVPEDPYYNWGWMIFNMPHALHGTPGLFINPTTLTVMIPLFSIILGVWLTYAYVYRLIFKIKGRGGRSK